MGETPDEIKREIELTRERIRSNLNQLEHRVRGQFDWRSSSTGSRGRSWAECSARHS